MPRGEGADSVLRAGAVPLWSRRDRADAGKREWRLRQDGAPDFQPDHLPEESSGSRSKIPDIAASVSAR